MFEAPWFEKKADQYPELLLFLVPEVDVSADHLTTTPPSWSEALYQGMTHALEATLKREGLPKGFTTLLAKARPDVRSPELERTCLSLMVAASLRDPDVSADKFRASWPPLFGAPMTIDQLDAWRALGAGLPEHLEQLALVVGDLGKLRALRRQVAKAHALPSQNPDQWIDALLARGQRVCQAYLPSLQTVGSDVFEQLRMLHPGFHFGHFAHAESTHLRLVPLCVLAKEHPETLRHALHLQRLDVAGAAGQTGRCLMNEDIATTYTMMEQAFEGLHHQPTERVYDRYLAERMKRCGWALKDDTTWPTLTEREHRAGRLLAMLRLTTLEEARDLQTALAWLVAKRPDVLEALAAFERYQATGLPTPTYLPALLQALRQDARAASVVPEAPNSLAASLALTFPWVANVCDEHLTLIKANTLSPETPLNFNGMTRVVKEAWDDAIDALTHPAAPRAIGRDGDVLPEAWVRKQAGLRRLSPPASTSSPSFGRQPATDGLLDSTRDPRVTPRPAAPAPREGGGGHGGSEPSQHDRVGHGHPSC